MEEDYFSKTVNPEEWPGHHPCKWRGSIKVIRPQTDKIIFDGNKYNYLLFMEINH